MVLGRQQLGVVVVGLLIELAVGAEVVTTGPVRGIPQIGRRMRILLLFGLL